MFGRPILLSQKRSKHSGVGLLEVLVALTILAMMLVTASQIRLTFAKSGPYQENQLSGMAIIRQAGMDYIAGVTNGLTEGTTNIIRTTGRVEKGGTYELVQTIDTNAALGFKRMNLDLSITDGQGGESFGTYGSRVFLTGITNTPPHTDVEPVLNVSRSQFTLTVAVNTNSYVGASPMGTVQGSGVYPYGTMVTIIATPRPPYQFNSWSGQQIDNTNSVQTTVLIDDDKTVTASFRY